MSILKDYDYEIVLITPKKVMHTKRTIEEIAGIEISHMYSYKDHYDRVVNTKSYDSWLDYVEGENLFAGIDNVAHIVVFGGLLSSSCGITRKQGKLPYITTTNQQMNFVANGTYMCGYFQLMKLSNERDIPFHEVVYDTNEATCDDLPFAPRNLIKYHGYDFPEINLERADLLQHYISRNKYAKSEKEADITFGFTVLAEDRIETYETVIDCISKIYDAGLASNVFVRNKYLDIDTFVDRETYLSHIAKSRFTLLIPPYDETSFSIYRFIESLANDCLPLVAYDVAVDDFVNTFGVDRDVLKEIITTYDGIHTSIQSMGETRRLELLSYFKDKITVYNKGLKL